MKPTFVKPNRLITETRRAARHARQIAETSDRWFVSVGAALDRAGRWARRQSDIATESAVSAFATTVNVAKGFSPAGPTRTRSSPPQGLPVPAQPERDARLDFMPAVRAPSSCASPLHGLVDLDDVSTAPRLGSTRSPAGVVPLLRALGHTVASHTHAGYASLQQDARFWTLIHLLQTLGRPDIGASAEPNDLSTDANPRRET